mmetsp:Transcript_22736/g.47338  ORF Transcript_22736/g.47338 Transcript_22736/m.47338 type:complete len:229 (+) Transcript_22736:156-842(+)
MGLTSIPWQPAEDEAILDFVRQKMGDGLAPMGKNRSWADLEKNWESLGKVKGFRTKRNSRGMCSRHHKMRRTAGRMDSLPGTGSFNHWSVEELAALLGFVRDRKGDDMAECSERFFKDLEAVWKKSGFHTQRSAYAMYDKHYKMRRKRAKLSEPKLSSSEPKSDQQPESNPEASSTSSTTTYSAAHTYISPAPPLRSAGFKRNISTAFPATSPTCANAASLLMTISRG